MLLRRMLIMLGVVLVVVLALAAYKGFSIYQQIQMFSAPQPAISVSAAQAEQQPWQGRLPAIGTLKAFQGVDLSAEVKAKALPTDSVFIFARAVTGPPAPLAAKRVTVAELPVTVELGDADAMMPQLKLSNFPEVQLVARISRAGQPTTGEWIGRSQPLASTTTALQQLTIDSPDK